MITRTQFRICSVINRSDTNAKLIYIEMADSFILWRKTIENMKRFSAGNFN